MRIKHIDICQTFLRDIVEENDIYILSILVAKKNPRTL